MKIIAAVCNSHNILKHSYQIFGGGIGINNRLPWKIKRDMQFFKEMTIGDGKNAVVMGRKTWESLPRALPKRDNLVLSRTIEDQKNMTSFNSINDLEIHVENQKYDDVWIIGGSSIYDQFYNKSSHMYITNIDKYYTCDSFFLDNAIQTSRFELKTSTKTYYENYIPFKFQIFTNQTEDCLK